MLLPINGPTKRTSHLAGRFLVKFNKKGQERFTCNGNITVFSFVFFVFFFVERKEEG